MKLLIVIAAVVAIIIISQIRLIIAQKREVKSLEESIEDSEIEEGADFMSGEMLLFEEEENSQHILMA